MISLFKKEKTIEFDSFRLKISRMRGSEVYEGQKTATGIHLEHYTPGRREYGSVNRVYKETKKMIKTIEGDQQLYEEIAQLFAEYKIKRWDGFHGANPPGLRDGTMMDFDATLSDGTRIDADGSNNFPKHFRDFQEKLHDIFERELTTKASD